MDGNRRSRDVAILLGVYLTFALDVYSAFTSSPQTTEINAQARADTLMKWVKVSSLVAVGGGAVASYVDKSPLPLVATSIAAVAMYLVYEHAKQAGLESAEPGTERYY